MDIFKFNNDPSTPTKMQHGEILNGLKSKLWIERFREVGEFKLIAPVSSGLREKLPIGTFLSHTDTLEIMIVEDHEINEAQGEESTIIFTGRSLESWLENRVLGANYQNSIHLSTGDGIVHLPPGVYSYTHDHYTKDYAWSTVMQLFNEHVNLLFLNDDNDQFPYLDIVSLASGGNQAIRKLDRGMTVLDAILKLLAMSKLGWKSQRPSDAAISFPNLENTHLIIHPGIDLTDKVSFSYDGGEILDADYFWSNRNFKNFAYISSKWVETWADNENTDYNHRRRYIWVDGSDLDNDMDTEPTGSTLDILRIDLVLRAQEELKAYNETNLTKVNASHNPLDSQYRTDFNCGDLVTVNGTYNDSLTMRVTEYAEIEDENGEQGYPTLVVEDV